MSVYRTGNLLPGYLDHSIKAGKKNKRSDQKESERIIFVTLIFAVGDIASL